MIWDVVLSMDLWSGNSYQSVLHHSFLIDDCFYSLDCCFSLAPIFLIAADVIEDVPSLVGVVFLILTKTAFINIYVT